MPQHEFEYFRDWVIRKPVRRGSYWMYRVRNVRTNQVREHNTRESRRREADRKIRLWIERDLDARQEKIRFEHAAARFLEQHCLGLKHTTSVDYRTMFRVFNRQWRERYVDSLTVDEIEEFLGRECSRLSPRTVRKYRNLLGSFFVWCKRRYYVERNPVEGLRCGGPPEADGYALSHEEARAFVMQSMIPVRSHCFHQKRQPWEQVTPPSNYLSLALRIALHTGFRRHNVLELKWKQVDLDDGWVSVPASEWKNKQEHSVPLHPELYTTLKDLRPQDQEQLVLGRLIKNPTKAFHRVRCDAGLPYFKFKDLRHSFGTWLMEEPFAVSQRLLGHSLRSQPVTLRYLHPTKDRLIDAIRRLPNLLS